jgi:hypothetical protein
MADFGAPVAQNVNTGNGVQTLSGLIGLQSQRLGIQQQQQALQGQAAQVQQEQQTAQQRSGIASFMSSFDPTQHVGSDGTLDLDAVLTDPKLRQAAGDQFPALMQQMVQVKSAQLGAKQQLASLNGDLRNQFSQTIGSLRTDPEVVKDTPAGRQKVQQAMGDFAETGGPDAARVANIYAGVVNHVPQGKLSQTLSNFQLQAMDTGAQSARQAPTYANTGGKLVQTNPQAAGGSPQGDLTNTVGPGMSTFQDQAGNTWSVNPQNPGAATLVGHGNAPRGTSDTPGAPPVLSVGGKENTAASALNDEQTYSQVRTAANKAPVTKNILQSISTLADQSKTGVGSKEIANAESVISQYIPGFKAAGDAATNRQLLGKYVEQLALQTAEANGASTDQARATVASAIPDPEHMTPQAIKRAAQFIQSQTQISQARGAVAEKYRQEHGGSSQGLRGVDAAFMQNLDPRAFDYISLPKEQRAQFLQQHFPDQASRQAFAHQLAVIDHYGGFNYAR